MTSIPRMGRRQRRRLIRLGRETGDAATALRFHMIAELSAGRSRNEVARRLCAAVSTVCTTATRYLSVGLVGLFDGRGGNGRRKVDYAFQEALREVLFGVPTESGWSRPTWTRELLCEEMVRRGHARVAVATMGRALRRLGARLGRPKPIVLCHWPRTKRMRLLAKLKRLAASDCANEPVYYSDEVDIDLNPKIGRDWMLPGKQRRVLTPGTNQKHYIAGALRVKSRRLVWTEGASKNSALFCKLLLKLAATHRRARACISSSTTTPSTAAGGHRSRLPPWATKSACISCLPTARTTIESNAHGGTCTTTSLATTDAARWRS
jgi:transposase